jgi:hypothetical protein
MKPAARMLFLLVCAASLPVGAQQAPRANLIECTGPFAKDSSHSRLVEAFGAANVVFGDIGGPEGESQLGSNVFPDEPRRRFTIVWKDEAGRRNPQEIHFREGSAWRTRAGIHVGSNLAEVERLNGKPFTMWGFEWDYGGYVRDWRGGTLDQVNGECLLGMRFELSNKAPHSASDRILGERTIPSNDPEVRAVRPRTSEIYLKYPQ